MSDINARPDVAGIKGDADWAKFQQFMKMGAASGDAEGSGKGDQTTLPEDLRGLNWGACIMNVVWGGAMRVTGGTLFVWFILMLVPFIGVIFPFYLLFKGNEIAWASRTWHSKTEYRETQAYWTRLGVILLIVVVVLVALLFAFIQSKIRSLLGGAYRSPLGF